MNHMLISVTCSNCVKFLTRCTLNGSFPTKYVGPTTEMYQSVGSANRRTSF